MAKFRNRGLGPSIGGDLAAKSSRIKDELKSSKKIQGNRSAVEEIEVDESRTPFKQLLGSLLAAGPKSARERMALQKVEDELREDDSSDFDENDEETVDEEDEDEGAVPLFEDENDDEENAQDLEEYDEVERVDGNSDAENDSDADDVQKEDEQEEEEAEEDGEDEERVDNEGSSSEEDDGKQSDNEKLESCDPFILRCADPTSHQTKMVSVSAPIQNQTSYKFDNNEALESTDSLFMVGSIAALSEESQFRFVKARLVEAFKKYRSKDKDKRGGSLSPFQRALCNIFFNSYADIGFFGRNLENAVDLRELQVLHVLNHVLKARDLVERHNERINQRTKEARSTGKPPEFTESEEDEFRDQGFTRARVLVVLPYKSSAFKFVKLLLELFPPKTRVRNYERFQEEFGPLPDESMSSHDQEWRIHQIEARYSAMWKESDYVRNSHPGLFATSTESESSSSKKKTFSVKPKEWHAVFDESAEEDFRLGIAINSKRSVKLFSSFYDSDIIVASPLGIRLATKQAVGADAKDDVEEEKPLDEEDEETKKILKFEGDRKKKPQKDDDETKEDTDFLSSIEVLVIDECDAFHMQNWQHLEDVCVAINRRPTKMRPEMDFSRVYSHFLDGKPRMYRQTILTSAFLDASINALISRGGIEHEGIFRSPLGSVKIKPKAIEGNASLVQPGLVQRFKHMSSDDARFEHFVSKIIPKLCRVEYGSGILLFVPSYLDFIRLKKAFAKEEKEYMREAKGLGLFEADDADDVDVEQQDEDGAPAKKRRKKRPIKAIFQCCTEYTTPANVSRARAKFLYGNCKVLIMTERYYYYFRSRYRGVKRVVMYAPPQHPNFYEEILNWIQDPRESESVCFFTKTDALELERIVGTKQTKRALMPPLDKGAAGAKVKFDKKGGKEQTADFTIVCAADVE